MKKLPLLSSSFELFSWETSIGDATNEQVQKAYEILTSQGATTEFSRKVWNDLVELLYQAMKQAGFSWDSTYGSVDDTKMTVIYDELTSYRFNAITQNITKLIGTTWRWEADDSKDGFIGRRQVYGVSEIGAKADFVYGWYLIELARVINVFIDILKNDANFREFIYSKSSKTTPNVTLSPKPSKPLTYTKSSETNTSVRLSPIPSMPLYVQEIIRTACSVDLNMLPPMKMNTESSSKTYNKVIFERIRPIYSGAKHISESLYESSMEMFRVLVAFSNQLSNSISSANMMIKPPSYISSTNLDITLNEGSINLIVPLYQDSTNISYSSENGEVRNVKPYYLGAGNTSKSTTKNKLSKLLPKLFYSNVKSETTNASSLMMPKANNLESHNKSTTLYSCELSKGFILEDSDNLSNTIHDAELNYSLPLKIVSSVLSRSKTHATMMLEKAEEGTWVIRNGDDLYIKQVYSSEQKGNELFIDNDTWLEPIKNGSNLYIRQMYEELNNKED